MNRQPVSRPDRSGIPPLVLTHPSATALDAHDARGTASNLARAEWAREALERFARRSGLLSSRTQEDFETIVSDFLADLLHLCRMNDVDFDECADRARANHDAERRGERLAIDDGPQ